MSQVPFYPAAQPGGAYPYSATPQGMPTQAQYPTQFVMMQNVQPGTQGQPSGYTIQQPFQMHPGNHAYMQGPPRPRTDQYGQGLVLAPTFQPQAGQGQHSGVQQVLMPLPQQYMNAQTVQLPSFSGQPQWTNSPQYANGPQQPSHAPNSFSQSNQSMYKKPSDQRSQQQMYYSYNNTAMGPIAQPMGGQPNGLPQQPSVPPQSVKQSRPRTSAIQIIDPNTGLELKTEDLTKSSSVNSQSASAGDVSAPSVSPAAAKQVAADFAARVAATLNTSSDSGAKLSTIAVVTAPVAESAPTLPAIVSDGLSLESGTQSGVACQQETSAPTPINSINTAAAREESASVCLPSSTVEVIESSSSATLLTIPPTSAANVASSADESVASTAEVQLPRNISPDSVLSDSRSDDVRLPISAEQPNECTVEVDSPSVLLSGNSVEVVQSSCEEVKPKSGSSSDVTSTEALQASAPATEVSKKEEPATGKDTKKKKNKKKDVNNKGQSQQQGTDMDAYIVQVDPKVRGVTEVTTVSATVETDPEISKPVETVPQAVTETLESPSVIDEAPNATVDIPVVAEAIDSRTVEDITESVAFSEAQAVDVAIVSEEPEQSAGLATAVDSIPMLQTTVVPPEIQADVVVDVAIKGGPSATADDEGAVDAEDAEAQKLDLKYKYAEEQWSPLNPEGKKQYDREFMMQLQYANLSRQKPANLPPLPDIILNELAGPRAEIGKNRSIELGRMGMGMAPDFTPGYVKSSPSGSKRGPVQRNSMNKTMGMGASGPSGGRKVISLTLQQDIQLNKADNAWKPTLVNKKDASDYSIATQELYKKVRGILNKLTPQKFATLMQQVLDLQIDTEERLKGCIDIIFEKAISEPNFSVAYANMAKRMLTLDVQKEQDPTQKVTFRTLLLNKCQQEFEKDKLEEMDLAERQKKIDEADSDDKRKLLTEELAEAATKSKRRSLGNIRFIGELYKLRMLTEAIMHECLMKLLRSNDEDSLECLCQLLTTIGQELDNKQSKLQPRMDMYFKQLDALINEKNKVSSRIRFMLLDTIDLRKSNWVPRRANNNPKTIEQIHKEAQEEEQKKHADMQKSVMERGRRGGGAGAGGGRGGPPQGGNAGEDGWNTVTRPPKSQIVDPQRLKLTKREQVDENIQLGPGGRGMTTWQFGSRGGGKAATVNATPDSDRQQNRYSLLNNAGFEQTGDSRNRGPSNRGSATPSGTSFRPNRDYQGSVSGPAGRLVGPRPSLERNNESRQDRRDFVSPASSRSASREPRPVEAVVDRQAPPMGAVSGAPVKTADRELSSEEIEKKTKSLMEEYLHLNDLKEATECVKELNSPNSLHLFVYHSLLLNLERSPQARQRTGALLHHLIKNRVLSNSQCIEGLRSLLELADDFEVDIPHVWQYFGDMIGPMVEEGGGLPLVSLRSACEPLLNCRGGDKAGVVISVVLHDAVHRLGHERVAELWQQSGLQWSEFVPADKVEIFLKENKLEFTQVKSESQPPKPVTAERLQEDLNRIYQDSDVADELVLDYLKENVGDVDGKCLRALTTAICSTALKTEVNNTESDEKKITFNLPLIKKRLALLVKVINSRAELEIEVLFAIQVVIHKKDVYTGAISELFDTLYDEDVVSDATFFRWRDDRMFGEQIGRGVAINTLNQFFKWLEEDTTAS